MQIYIFCGTTNDGIETGIDPLPECEDRTGIATCYAIKKAPGNFQNHRGLICNS